MGAGAGIACAYSASKFAVRGLTHSAGRSFLVGPSLSGSWIFVDEGCFKLPISGNTALL